MAPDHIARHLRIAHDGLHIVQAGDDGVEQANLRHRAFNTAAHHMVHRLAGPEENQEGAARNVGQQARSVGANGKANAGQQHGRAGRLDPEEAKDRHQTTAQSIASSPRNAIAGGCQTHLPINKRGQAFSRPAPSF
jgi:hypothetical protein